MTSPSVDTDTGVTHGVGRRRGSVDDTTWITQLLIDIVISPSGRKSLIHVRRNIEILEMQFVTV